MVVRFLLDDAGLELSEYAISAALITTLTLVAFTTLGEAVRDRINNMIAIINA